MPGRGGEAKSRHPGMFCLGCKYAGNMSFRQAQGAASRLLEEVVPFLEPLFLLMGFHPRLTVRSVALLCIRTSALAFHGLSFASRQHLKAL